MTTTIVVFCPNLVGDTVMATPAFRAVRSGYPEARIVAIIKPKVAPTLAGGPWFDQVIGLDPRSTNPVERTGAVVRQLKAMKPEIALLFPNSIRSALLAWRVGAKRRVGYARGGRGFLLTDRLIPLRDRQGRFVPSPIVDSYQKIAQAIGCEGDGTRLELYTTAEDEAAADLAWNRLGLSTSGPVVCLNTGGAFGPAKSWPEAHFAELARRLVDGPVAGVLVVCGPGERAAARSIVAMADRPNVVSLADQPLGLGLTKACIRRAAAMVTTDSGPRHFATALDVPVLTLFGPTHIAWTLTHRPRSIQLHHPVPCGPCQRPVCPERHHRCMRELSPDAVLAATLRLIRGEGVAAEMILEA